MLQNLQAEALEGQETNIITDYILKVQTQICICDEPSSKHRRKYNCIYSLPLSDNIILQILGLEMCADTMVGDEMIRGISGGQRKRLTTGKIQKESFLWRYFIQFIESIIVYMFLFLKSQGRC